MSRIYVSDYGSDKNDGLSKQTAIYSWKRARKLYELRPLQRAHD